LERHDMEPFNSQKPVFTEEAPHMPVAGDYPTKAQLSKAQAQYVTDKLGYDKRYSDYRSDLDKWQKRQDTSAGALKSYQESPLGQAAAVAKPTMALPGALAGGWEAHRAGDVMWGLGKGQPAEAGFLRRAGIGLPTAFLGAKSWELADKYDQAAEDESLTPAERDYNKATANFFRGAAAANLGYTGINSMRGIGRAPAGPAPVAELPPETPPPPEQTPIGKSGDPHSAVTNEIAKRLSLPVKGTKKEIYTPIEPGLRKANEEQLRTLAKDIHAYDPAALEGVTPDAPLGKVRTAVINFARKVGTKPGNLAGLGILGGLAAESWPTRAEAAKPTDLPAREELAAGLGRGWEAAKALPGQLLSGIPGSLRENTPGMQSGELGLTPEEFQLREDARTARAANFAAAQHAHEQENMANVARAYPEPKPEEVPPALRNYAGEGQGFAKGGAVVHSPQLKAISAKLSAMQHELQRALTGAVRRAEGLQGKKGADRHHAKVSQEKDGLIEDIWALHALSQKIMGGTLTVHPTISKRDLIGLARKHDHNTKAA
jgi:hypothetical protein